MRTAGWYRAMNYRPGGRSWMFRRPATMEFVLTLAHFGRRSGNPLSHWIYGHWPIEPRPDPVAVFVAERDRRDPDETDPGLNDPPEPGE